MDEPWQDAVVERARRLLPPHVFRYLSAGAQDEVTVGEARRAWAAVRFTPRVLHDVTGPVLTTSLLGQEFASPIGIAPTSMQRLAHPEGELAMAYAAAATDTLMVVSTNAGTSFEELAATGVRWWLQAYLTQDRALVRPVLERAVAAGARAVVLTVDTPAVGTKRGIDDVDFGDLSGVYRVNHDEPSAALGAGHAADLGPADIAWLGDVTGLPVVVKGVLGAADARRCVQAGARAVWVSNHGGRQLDRAVATASALPAVVASLEAEVEVYVDGGLSSGLDVLAALALGARGVFCGRLPLFGLVGEGTDGAVDVLTRLVAELGEAMQLAGCATVREARGIAS
ncbi:MAG: alpha-hydroxy acid oxidase [Nocardioides sp.]